MVDEESGVGLSYGRIRKLFIHQKKSYPMPSRNLLSLSTALRSPASACGWHRMGKAKNEETQLTAKLQFDCQYFPSLCASSEMIFMFSKETELGME